MKLLFEEDNRRKARAGQAGRISRILTLLNRAARPEDMALPGYWLYPLRGGLPGFSAMSVSVNRRIIWRFEGLDAADAALIDCR